MSSSSSSECMGCVNELDNSRFHKKNCYLNRNLKKTRARKKSQSPKRSRKKSQSPKRNSSTPRRRGKWEGESRSRSLSSRETLDGSDILCKGCVNDLDRMDMHCQRCNDERGFGTRRARGARRRTRKSRCRMRKAR